MQTYYAVGLCRHPILSTDVLWVTPSAMSSIKAFLFHEVINLARIIQSSHLSWNRGLTRPRVEVTSLYLWTWTEDHAQAFSFPREVEEISLEEVRGSRPIIEESKLSAVLSLNDFKILRKGGSIARRTWKDMPNKK